MGSGRGPRISWTEQEYEAVINRAAELRLQEHELPLLEIFQQAQEVLPSDRHRKIAGWVCLRDGTKERVKLRVDVLLKQRVTDAVANVPVEIREIPVVVEKDIDPVQFLRSLPTGSVIAECVTRICSRLDSLERALVGAHKNGHIEPPARPLPTRAEHSQPAAKRKPRIAIIGLFKDQFEHVREKLGDKANEVDLLYFDKEQQKLDIPPVDQIIVQRHTRHAVWEQAKNAAPGKVVFADGGISDVTRRCFDFLSRRNGISSYAH